jgi:hypothetical protein
MNQETPDHDPKNDRTAALTGQEIKANSEAPTAAKTKGHRLVAEGFAIEATFRAIGAHVEQPDASGGKHVESQPAEGGKAVSHIAADGSYSAEFSGVLYKGKPAEPHARRILVDALQRAGQTANETDKKPIDADGEDGFVDIDGSEFVVQVVTMPADGTLWGEVARHGRAARAGQLSDAVALVRGAIEHKAHARKNCVLVLDAANIGALPTPALVEAYMKAHGDPAAEFGLAQVWLVGPTPTSTFRLA